jgi:TonB family protein
MPAIFRSSFSLVLLASLLASLLTSSTLAQTPAPAGPPYRVEGDVKRPEKISGAPPTFTEEARKARMTGGVVILDVLIDEKGNVTDVKVLQGLAMGLEEAAVKAVKRWKFKPATLDGQPVPVYYILTVNFTSSADGLTFGPLLSKFVEENRDFRELVTRKRFGEALALLESRDAGSSGPEIRLARAFVLSALGRLDEAWEEAQAYDGPEPYEVFQQVAFSALNAAAGTRDQQARAAFLEVGLQSATRAMDARENDKLAMLTKSQLLKEKARLTAGPERAALLEEANELHRRAGLEP